MPTRLKVIINLRKLAQDGAIDVEMMSNLGGMGDKKQRGVNSRHPLSRA